MSQLIDWNELPRHLIKCKEQNGRKQDDNNEDVEYQWLIAKNLL